MVATYSARTYAGLFQDRHCKYNVIVQRSRNHSCRGKTISVTCSECVSVALVTHHAKRKRHFIFPYLTCLDLPYFCTISYKRHDFSGGVGGGMIEHKMCVLIFSATFVRNISHSKKNSARYYHKCTEVFMQQDIIIHIHMSSCQVPTITVRF